MPDEDDDGQVMPEIRRSPNELRHSLDQADHKLSPVLGKRVVVKKQNKLIPLALAIGSVAVLAVSFFLFQHFKEKKAFEAYRDQINSLLRQADYVQAKEVIQEAMRGSFSGPFQAELGQLNAKADLELKHINDEINHYLEQARTHEMQGNRLKNGVNDAFGQYVGILRMDSRHEESQAQLERIKTLELQEMDRQGRATLADQIVHLGKLRIMAGHFKKDEALRQRYQDLLLSLQQGRGKELEEQINKLFAQRKYVNIPPLVDELQSIDPSSTFLKEASEKLIKALLAEGDKLVEVQNYEKAESLFLTAMNLDPKNTSIQQKVENVKANAETARIENAVNLLEEAKNNGQLKLQLIHAQALQEIDPGNALARSTLSEVNEKLRSMRAEADRLRHLGRFREAGKEYKAIYDIQATEELKTLYQKYQSWTPPQGMAFIPGGFFQMGSHYEQGAAPMHGVELSPFFVDQREVTNGEFYQFVQNQPEWQPGRQDPARFTEKYLLHWQEGRPVPGTEHEPVRYISWFAAKAYSIWAGKRLLTEAEWEKAAAGGTSDQNYWWGNSPSAMNAVYRKYPQKRPAPVGSFPANEYGLHEILGNVSEWVEDSYDSDFYRTSRDSKDPVQSKGREKVHRGGSFIDQGRHITRYHRFHEDPTACLPNVGLRLAKDAQLR
jgi:formylglycine-generating enzyme required for sulfatase activity